MTAVPFDTLKLADELEAAGFTHSQARAQAKILTEVATSDRSAIATKIDLAEIRLEIEKTKADLVRWVVGVGVLQTSVITALLLKIS